MRDRQKDDDAGRPSRRGLLTASTTDAELLEATADGREDAFGELRRRYRRMIDSVCRSLLGRDAAEDCDQEVFVRVWQKAPLYDRSRGSAPAWVMTVARNVGRNLLPRHEAVPALLDDRPDPDSGPGLERLWLAEALSRLPTHERRVIELAYVDDLSQSQIAELLRLPLGTVKTWNRRGLRRLATELEDEP